MITQPIAAIETSLAGTLAIALVPLFSGLLLQAWRYRREASDEATRVLRQYRDPLLRAAYDLQSRLYNISAREYLEWYWRRGDTEQKENAIYGTLWLFGQYLGWTEILRREIQYLDVGSRLANQQIQGCLNRISAMLSTDSPPLGTALQIVRGEQRAVGDFMIAGRAAPSGGSRPDCLGYSEFISALPPVNTRRIGRGEPYSPVATWRARLSTDLERAGAGGADHLPARLATVQRLLVDLVDLLDPDRSRIPDPDYRGRLPAPEGSEPVDDEQLARFIWPWSDPWPEVERWAERRHLSPASARSGADTRIFRGRRGPTLRRPELTIAYTNKRLIVKGCSRRGGSRAQIDGSLRMLRARSATNDLLRRFERPPIHGSPTIPARLSAKALALLHRLRGRPAAGLPS